MKTIVPFDYDIPWYNITCISFALLFIKRVLVNGGVDIYISVYHSAHMHIEYLISNRLGAF